MKRPRERELTTTRTEEIGLLGERRSQAGVGDAGLVLLYAPEPEALPAVLPLSSAEPLFIGREPPQAGLTIAQGGVSRVHARIHHQAGAWQLTDLDSRNGTLVGGVRVEQRLLADWDEIRIGDAIFWFVSRGIGAFTGHRLNRSELGSGAVVGPRSAQVLAAAAAVARSNLALLILGQTGTGKELVAQRVHAESGRAGKLCALNCAAVPTHIIESELFGHRRGAFTGADRDKRGLLATADGGTLFLDEIGELALDAQAKLLRAIETGELLPLGATTPERVDVRFVAATNRDLPALVREGGFRADLYARLGGHVVRLQPLSWRKEEIVPLVWHFLHRHGRPNATLTASCAAALIHYSWPFNVRELEQCVRRAIALLDAAGAPPDAELDLDHLPDDLLEALEGYGDRPSSVGAPPSATAGQPGSGGRVRAPSETTLRELLTRHGGNVAAVARELDKDRVQIHRWMRRYAIDPAAFRG